MFLYLSFTMFSIIKLHIVFLLLYSFSSVLMLTHVDIKAAVISVVLLLF